MPDNNLWWREAFNSAHVFLFFFLSFIIYHQLTSANNIILSVQLNNPSIYFLVLTVGLLFGFVIEGLQSLTGREASFDDIYKDFFGLLTGICMIAASDIKEFHRQRVLKPLYLTAGFCFILLGLNPLIQLSWHYVARADAFPVIIDLNAPWASSFVRFNNAEMVYESVNNEDRALIRFNSGEYPGVAIIEPEADWSGYRLLRFDVLSPYNEDIKVVIRVHDESHNQELSDRFNKTLVVSPGLTRVEIKLSQIQYGPVDRNMDLTKIAGIVLFLDNPEQPLQLEVSRLILE